MKTLNTRCFLVFMLFAFAKATLAQLGIGVQYNVMHVANNTAIIMNYSWKKVSVAAGVKYLLPQKDNFPVSVVYKKTFWPNTLQEHFGAMVNIDYLIINKEHFQITLYYDVQFTKSHIKHLMYYALYPIVPNPQSEEDYVYQKKTVLIGPILAIENNFGINFNFKLNKRLYLSQKIGGGIVFLKNMDNSVILGARSTTWELCEQISISLIYKFKSKNIKNLTS